MNNRSFKITVLVAASSAILFGCDGPDKGYSNNFTASSAVAYSNASIDASFDEVSGMQSVDLLQGATVDGSPLAPTSASPVYVRALNVVPQNANFVTPESAGLNTLDGDSPFRMSDDGLALDIDTDMYAEALRMCDPTDVRGATDADGNPIGDGVRDFPTSIDYVITFIVDNGYEYPAGQSHPERTLNLTINAISDVVTDVQAFDLSVAAGDTVPMLSATAPAYACNPDLTYEIADEAIATVDAAGMVTGAARGDTTITVTSVENPALSATATVSVTPGFNLAITNQDFNDLGAPLGTKTVPACSAIGISVEPSIVADNLQGAYTYDWTSVNAAAPLAAEESDGAFGATGRFTNGLAVGEMTDITVGYDSGYTGATDPADVEDQMVSVTVEQNLRCDPGVSAHAGGWVTDLDLDGVWPGGVANWGANVTYVNPGLDGTSLLVTSPGGDILDVTHYNGQWNNQRNWFSANMGTGTAIGQTYKFSMWARLGQLPTAGDVTLEHTLLPWTCTGCPSGPGYNFRRPFAGTLTSTLKPTTDWQLVEFINPLTGTNEWSVPDHWDLVTPVFLFFDVYGLEAGQTVELDDHSIVRVP